MQLIRCGGEVRLHDGSRLHLNDRVIDLHFWNEQLPRMPDHGPTVAWARRFKQAFDSSFYELARYLASRPDVEDVKAFSVNMSVGTAQQRDQLSRIVARYGFQTIHETHPPSARQRLRRFGENLLYFMMVYAINPPALRREVLRRDRAVAYLPRRLFEQAFSSAPAVTSALTSQSIASTPAKDFRRQGN